MEKKILYPVDRASFKGIREGGFLYVDKTGYISTMTHQGKYYFLARPRRFGKSLFLDTLAEYFKGNRKLFKGLEIDRLQPEEWETYPVVHFNFSGNAYLCPENLSQHLLYELKMNESEYGLDRSEINIPNIFNNLITQLAEKHGKQVVILIDEYDAPLTATIDRPELQTIYREQLHGFYSVLKKAEQYIKFCFLTGVTRYGKVSVFSGLNNLKDVTFSDTYAGICGITKEELVKNYKDGVKALAQKEGVTMEEAFELLKFNYDGYHFSFSMLDIYNPFSINNCLQDLKIDDYWCQSGVPTILAKSLMQNDYNVAKLTGSKVLESDLKDLSMYGSDPLPLFYQTGYLTLKEYDPRRKRYTLGYPNREVETGILRQILNFYAKTKIDGQNTVFDLEDSLDEGNPKQFVKILSSFLSDIPLDLREHVSKYENYYHSIIYCIVKLMGLDIDAEYATSEGYIDILVKTREYVYVIELKVNGTAEDAIRQIEEKHYCAPFGSDRRRLFKIGLGFSKETGSINTSIII